MILLPSHHDLHGGVYLFCMMIDFSSLWFAEALSCEKFYRGMYSFLHCKWFQLTWGSLVPAIIFSGQFAAEWCIQIWIWYQKQTFWLETPELVSTIGHSHHWSWWLGLLQGNVMLWWEHYFSFSGAWGIWPLLVLYTMVSIFICGSWIWTLYWVRYLTSIDFMCCDAHLHLSELNLDIALRLGHLVPIVYIYSWWFCIAWLSGDFIEIIRIDFAGDCVM